MVKLAKDISDTMGIFKQSLPIAIVYGICLCCVASNQPTPSFSIDLESELRKELFANYSVLQRPEQTVNVKVSLTLLTVNSMDIKDESLSISGYLTLTWQDTRLSWLNVSKTSQDYSNVRFLFSTETYVWRPVIMIENSNEKLSVISNEHIPMRIQSSGRISWSPSGIFVVSCDSDITYYPLDYQSCYVKVSTWGYTQTEITLHYDQDTPVELGFYSTNGEWDLVSADGSETEDRSRGGQTFSTLKFQIDLQRLPLYHVMNTLFPVLLMAFLIPAAFKVPPGCGEKIGYTLTVLLAYAVYLTIVSDNIPSTSENVSYLSIYLGLIFLYGVISVFLVILVLCLHEKPEGDPIPAWLKKLTLSFLIPVTCWKQGIGWPNKRKKFAIKHDLRDKVKVQEKKQNGSFVMEGEDPDDHAQLKWQTIAGALDNFLFMIMMIVIVITTLVLFTIMVVNYAKNA